MSETPKLLGIRHVALKVRDLDRCLRFYADVLGMQVEWRPDPDNAYLTSGSDNLALHRSGDSADDGPRTGQVRGGQTLDHFGFVVPTPEDVDQWAKYLRNKGVALEKEPRTHRDGARSCYFRDPEGVLIQIIYHPPISSPPRRPEEARRL